MLETYEYWLGLENNRVCYASETHEIYQVLHCSVDSQDSRELWNPMTKTVVSKRSFVWSKGL